MEFDEAIFTMHREYRGTVLRIVALISRLRVSLDFYCPNGTTK